MTTSGKPPKVVLVAVARKLLVFAYAVIRAKKTVHTLPERACSSSTPNTVSPGDRPEAGLWCVPTITVPMLPRVVLTHQSQQATDPSPKERMPGVVRR